MKERERVRFAAELAIEHACPEGRRAQSGSLYMPRIVKPECHRHAKQAQPLNGDAQTKSGFHAFP